MFRKKDEYIIDLNNHDHIDVEIYHGYSYFQYFEMMDKLDEEKKYSTSNLINKLKALFTFL